MADVLSSYAIGTLTVICVTVAWVAIQGAWGRMFADGSADADVLARRTSCGSCGCMTPCTPAEGNERSGRAGADEERKR